MSTTSRRQFLQQASTAAAVMAYGGSFVSWGDGLPIPGQIRAWRTGGQERFTEIQVEDWRPSAAVTSGAVEIDATRQFQSVLGFGAAFTGSSCYLMNRMDAGSRRRLLEELFGRGGLGLSVGRTCIGSSDYSLIAYSYDDCAHPDPDLAHFSIAPDREYILPTLRDALAANPDLYLFSAPWSPPGWMKAGGSLLGGSMRKHSFPAYAQYFVKFLEAYKAEGIPIRAVSSQNEVDTDQDGRMPAALWGQEYEIGFVKDFLAPALRSASLDTKIWLLDHNYNLWGRAIDELQDAAVCDCVDGVAWHGYEGTPDAMTRVHDAHPAKNAYWTEGGPDISDPHYGDDWAKWSATYAGILKNWSRCIVGWNLVLDENGKPNIGPFECGGLVTLDSRTQKITRSGQYWAFAHYSKKICRGARVIASRSSLAGIQHAAFINPGGDYVLVLTNQGEERDVECRLGGKFTPFGAPAGFRRHAAVELRRRTLPSCAVRLAFVTCPPQVSHQGKSATFGVTRG
jgi:glucosylceramidase